MALQPFSLATSNFAKFRPEMGVPVRISNGRPKWELRYDLRYRIEEAFPAWTDVRANLSEEKFADRYFRRLDRFGVTHFVDVFGAIAADAGKERLVLLCFENLEKSYCHRRMFADWWLQKTGEIVDEL